MAKMVTKGKRRKPIQQLALGTIFIVTGCTLLITLPWIMNCVLENILTLKPDGIAFKLWKKNPMPSALEIYLFNWTNPEDIRNPYTKPHLTEVGPMVFKEISEKVNIIWNSNNTVTFKRLKYWFFDESRSAANLSDRIITINPIVLTAAYSLRLANYVLKKGLDFGTKMLSEKIHIEKSISEIIFDGFDDPLINIKNSLPQSMLRKMPEADKFGFFYMRNGSSDIDGIFNMETNGDNFGNLREWNYMKESSYFKDKCNTITGSTAEFYPKELKRSKVSIFSSDMCRSIPLDYSEDVIVDGMMGYKYVAAESFFDNGTVIPENQCYITGENIPSGVLNVSSCKYGAPAFVSMPHFYGADPYYLEKLEGLSPNKEKHQMFLTVEPTSGIPLEVAVRFQINFLLQPIKGISLYNNVPTVFFPAIWFQQKQYPTVPEDFRFYVKLFLLMPTVINTLAGILIFVGITLIVLVSFRNKMQKIRRMWITDSKPIRLETTVGNAEESVHSLLRK